MRHTILLLTFVATGFLLGSFPSPTAAQTPDSVVPDISARQYSGGSAMVIVKGAVQISQEVEINKMASFSSGDMTWLQFGVSGSPEPNLMITYGEGIGEGVGINVGKGKLTVTAGSELCNGQVTITAALLSGRYICTGVTSYDGGTGRMGKVDVEITFTAKT